MTARLKIGSGLARARKNRSRGPRAKAETVFAEIQDAVMTGQPMRQPWSEADLDRGFYVNLHASKP